MLSLHQTTTTTTTTIMPCGFCRNLNLPASIVNSHFARTCPRLAQTECLLCGKKGHTASRCPMKLKESWNKPRVEKSTDGWSVKRGAIISTSSIPFIVTNKPQNRFNTIAVPEEVKETRNLFKESPPAPKLTGAWSKGAPKDKPKPGCGLSLSLVVVVVAVVVLFSLPVCRLAFRRATCVYFSPACGVSGL